MTAISSALENIGLLLVKEREDYLDLETRFEKGVRLRLTAGRAQYQEQGEESLDALVRSTLEEFKKSFGK